MVFAIHRLGPALLGAGRAALHSSAPAAQRPIKKLLAANRSEIAIRIFRAASELNIKTVAIFSKEDIRSVHRYKADEAYMIGKDLSPVGAYLAAEEIVQLAKELDVDAIHPGYGFLSENVRFAQLCEENDISFIGPKSTQLARFGDKTEARNLAIEAGLPVVQGSGPVATYEEAREFVEGPDGCGYPVIVKAAHGGGGKGMRVVREASRLESSLQNASSEAKTAFGDGTVFVERYVDSPRHIEVQILGDGNDVVHLYDRDCSVQRRHQKVVELAPAANIDPAVRVKLLEDAKSLTRLANYRSAGTVEYLYEPSTGQYFFMELNPRIQVEHTVTEQVTGVDLVQSQIRIAGGKSLEDLGLNQDSISVRGAAIQCRITTEDPQQDFRPDTGRISVWRPADGMGIRLDGVAYAGFLVTPFYDSMLMKVTANALTFQDAADKITRALNEFRIRGLKTNIPFMLNVVSHPEFRNGNPTTSFIADNPGLMDFTLRQNRASKLLNYLGDIVVNGRNVVGATGPDPPDVTPPMPECVPAGSCETGWRNILLKEGPAGFVKAVREHPKVLFTDTTWRDAHQSLLATRMRTHDMKTIAPATSHILQDCYSIENWGGATFDVAMRFLHECPWERLGQLREQVPNVPFQMLFRGANAVGYTSYPDNAIYKFCDLAHEHGMDVFRVFDSLNYIDNLRLGIDAAGQAGGVVEGCLCYTGDVANPGKSKYNLEYYMNLAEQLVSAGAHVLCVKDMAGLLKPEAATLLIGSLRQAYPDVPIHVHTHDTGGLGVTSMIACFKAGADVVDGAMDSMSGMTSQPSLGAMVSHFEGSEVASDIKPTQLRELNEYWESTRQIYAPFESGQKTGSSDVYWHEIPGGQFTNLYFQANQLGLSGQWREIKKAYAAANQLLGDIVKVTPSSKVVGDLAQFMVQNQLSAEDVLEQAESLSFPTSVVDYFQGNLGQPPNGFPEPLRARVLKGKPTVSGRPGADLDPLDFEAIRKDIAKKFHSGRTEDVSDTDVMSSCMYPKEYNEYRTFQDQFGDVSQLPTLQFLKPLENNEEFFLEIEKGKLLAIKFLAKGPLLVDGTREVFFLLNGVQRSLFVEDKAAAKSGQVAAKRPKADSNNELSVGAPMPGAVVDVLVKTGDMVKSGQPCVVLNAMKMETVVVAPTAGTVRTVIVTPGEEIAGNDLLFELDPIA
eukprot:m.74266 g.74266  ORF g.74266 m.74266 type:complete len:1183 (-) comp14420_c0_seq2:68-3616(-)